MSIFTQERTNGRTSKVADNQRDAFAGQYYRRENWLNQTPAPKKCAERAFLQNRQALHSLPSEVRAIGRGLSRYQERCAPSAPRPHAGLLAIRVLPQRPQASAKWPRPQSFAPRPEHQPASLKTPFAIFQSITCHSRFAEVIYCKGVAA